MRDTNSKHGIRNLAPLAAALVLLGLGCPSGKQPPPTTSPTAAPTPTPKSNNIAVYPLRVVAANPGAGDPQGALELREDGTIWSDKGENVARIEGNRIIGVEEEVKGAVLLELAPDGTITTPYLEAEGEPGGLARVKLSSPGEITITNCYNEPDKECRLTVAEDGAVSMRETGKEPEVAPFKFESMRPEARDTAVLLIATVLLAAPVKIETGPLEESTTPPKAP